MKDLAKNCTFFSLALDESTDICDVAQLSIFIRGIDKNFNGFEELLSVESLHMSQTYLKRHRKLPAWY